MSNLYRLVYTSVRKPECTYEEIQNILDSCKKNNPGDNLTGVLLHSKNRFIQYLEGDKDKVRELFEKVKGDPRHTSVNERDFSPITERIFPSWNMGYKDADQLNFHTELSADDRSTLEKLITGQNDFTDRGLTVLKLFFELSK